MTNGQFFWLVKWCESFLESVVRWKEYILDSVFAVTRSYLLVDSLRSISLPVPSGWIHNGGCSAFEALPLRLCLIVWLGQTSTFADAGFQTLWAENIISVSKVNTRNFWYLVSKSSWGLEKVSRGESENFCSWTPSVILFLLSLILRIPFSCDTKQPFVSGSQNHDLSDLEPYCWRVIRKWGRQISTHIYERLPHKSRINALLSRSGT